MIESGIHLTPSLLSGLITLVVTIVGGLVLNAVRPKVRLQYFHPHGFAFDLPATSNAGAVNVFTQSLRVENVGTASASNLTIVLMAKPLRVKVFPAYEYDSNLNAEGFYFITIPSLAPKAGVSIELLDLSGPVPQLHDVRCDEAIGRHSARHAVPIIPKWLTASLLVFSLFGLLTTIFVCVRIMLNFLGLVG